VTTVPHSFTLVVIETPRHRHGSAMVHSVGVVQALRFVRGARREYHPSRFGGNQEIRRGLRFHLWRQEKEGPRTGDGPASPRKARDAQKERQARQEEGQEIAVRNQESGVWSQDPCAGFLTPDTRLLIPGNEPLNHIIVNIARDAVARSSPYADCSDEELLALFRKVLRGVRRTCPPLMRASCTATAALCGR